MLISKEIVKKWTILTDGPLVAMESADIRV